MCADAKLQFPTLLRSSPKTDKSHPLGLGRPCWRCAGPRRDAPPANCNSPPACHSDGKTASSGYSSEHGAWNWVARVTLSSKEGPAGLQEELPASESRGNGKPFAESPRGWGCPHRQCRPCCGNGSAASAFLSHRLIPALSCTKRWGVPLHSILMNHPDM